MIDKKDAEKATTKKDDQKSSASTQGKSQYPANYDPQTGLYKAPDGRLMNEGNWKAYNSRRSKN